MTELDNEINFLEMDIHIQATYLYDMQKLIGYPGEDQQKVKQEIAKAKKKIKQLKDKHTKLINQWAETEGKHLMENKQ